MDAMRIHVQHHTRRPGPLPVLLTLLLALGTACSEAPPGQTPETDSAVDSGADTGTLQTDTGSDEDAGEGSPDVAEQRTDTGPDASPSDTGSSGDAGAGDVGPPKIDVRMVVVDPKGRPVEEARVELGMKSGMTDQAGGVNFVDVNPGMVWLPVARGDRFSPSVAVLQNLPTSGTVTRYVTLLPAEDARSFDPTSPTTLIKDEVRIELPPDALQDAGGNAASGTVQAVIAAPNPESGELAAMPEDRRGGASESFGGLEVRFFKKTAMGRQPLELAPNKTADVEILLPEEQQDDFKDGDTLDISTYDMQTGQWSRDVQGTVRASSYASGQLAWKGQLSHFSWWNLRREFKASDSGCVRVKVQGPITQGVTVAARGVDYDGATRGMTDVNGEVCLEVASGKEVRIAVKAPEGLAPQRSAITATPSNQATCSAGSGCESVNVTLVEATCLAGTVRDTQGAAVGNASVRTTWDTGFGRIGTANRAGSGGQFCSAGPKSRRLTVYAAAKSGTGMPMLGAGSIETTPDTASCAMNRMSCTPAPGLDLEATSNATRCLHPSDDPMCADHGPASRIDRMDIAASTDNCCKNFDGQSGGDSNFPLALDGIKAASGGDLQPVATFEQTIATQSLDLVLEFFFLASPFEDSSFQIALHDAEELSANQFTVPPSSYKANGRPKSYLHRAALDRRIFRADLGRLLLPFRLGAQPTSPVLQVPLQAPDLFEADLQPGAQVTAGGELTFKSAKLAGWVSTTDLADALNAISQNACSCLQKDALDSTLTCQTTATDAANCTGSNQPICRVLASPAQCAVFTGAAKPARDVDADRDGTPDAWSFGAELSGQKARLISTPSP